MIQFKRGTTDSWKKLKKPLAAGQPGYDKDKHKIKVGDGEKLWEKLPYAGLSEEEVLDSESNAKKRLADDPESMAIITYGSEDPDRNTVGQLYLQYYETEPEVDYVVSYGTNGIWTYRKWQSGIAECWGACDITTAIRTASEGHLYSADNTLEKIEYPFTFLKVPSETATIQSQSGVVWLASVGKNSTNHTAAYNIISIDTLNNSTYTIGLSVKGYWK
jgi:hypothetical protein